MALDMSRIREEVEQAKTVQASAIALLGQVAQQIRDNASDQAALNALADELDAKNNELADAVAANTNPPEPA